MTKELLGRDMQQRLLHYYGLDKPLWEQYIIYFRNLLNGDLGFSYRNPGQTVNNMIKSTFPISAEIGALAYLLGTLLGIGMGAASVIHRNRLVDRSIIAFSVLNATLPTFVLASLLQYMFAVRLGWLPTARWGSIRQMILPVLSTMTGISAMKARTMRTVLIEIFSDDYIQANLARGLSVRQTVYRHGIRNALIPIVSVMGMELASVLTGTFVVEQVYAIPGFGMMFVSAVKSLDYSAILGMTIFYTVLIVLLNFVMDLIYCVIDPRVLLTSEKGELS